MQKKELTIEQYFTKTLGNKDALDSVDWSLRTAELSNTKGETIFKQENVRFPKSWSQTAVNIVASKYFFGKKDSNVREDSVRSMINRIVNTIGKSGVTQGYFDENDRDIFEQELKWLLVNQFGAFNSPVYFNVGVDSLDPDSQGTNWHWNDQSLKIEHGIVGYTRPQCSACFINSVNDSMESIMDLAKTEAMLFKWGSGTGTNLSSLRSSLESVSGGGVASGPLSFMKGYDAFAGVIKSGGKTRRAAKMVILNDRHPDIEDFIGCKEKEEAKAYALIAAGYDGSGPDAEAYSSVFYQNANNSVRVSDDFMSSVQGSGLWNLIGVKDGKLIKTVKAKELFTKMATAAWGCGDPGVQFDNTINDWHTCPESGRINASNPCSEYMFLDDSACNLASLNLMRFVASDGTFDFRSFKKAVRIFLIAQDILIDLSGYPTEAIAKNSHDYRPLGLGYANLGALLMSFGLPYDSDQGRELAAYITSIMTGTAYTVSAEMAEHLGPLVPANEHLIDDFEARTGKPVSRAEESKESGACPGWFLNSTSFMKVINKHRNAAYQMSRYNYLREASELCWEDAVRSGSHHGYRNAQVTVLAPTGTIGFMMDCDTTGIEPMLGLVTFKKMVGGGYMKLTYPVVAQAFESLDYTETEVDMLVGFINETGTLEGSGLDSKHLPIFDTALKSTKGTRYIAPSGHVDMMAAVQPFLSGAISKTVNMPETTTVADIEHTFLRAWIKGLKSIAIYRDGSKQNQVMTTKKEKDPEESAEVYSVTLAPENLLAPPSAVRHRLPDERAAVNHKFSIGGHEGYLNVGLYPDGEPGEIFVTMAKEGSTVSGLMDGLATVTSIALQHGVPLKVIVDKLSHMRFEPSGFTPNMDVKYAKSILDYVARYLDFRFIKKQQISLPMVDLNVHVQPEQPEDSTFDSFMDNGDSPACAVCGAITVRSGSCYKCQECGNTTGCS